MKAYIYKAALLCEDCGEYTRKDLDAQGRRPADPDNESTYDSDNYPMGPIADGGGESDYPAHCAECDSFLENPITADGVDYVREQYRQCGYSDTIAQWLFHYDYIKIDDITSIQP